MRVQAAPGVMCPKENNPRDYITDSEAIEVADSAYYHRLVADGSLVIAANAVSADAATDKKGGKK